MTPIILISHDEKAIADHINVYIDKEKILPYLVFTIRPLKEEITIDQIRQLKKDLIIHSPQIRVFVLYSFDKAGLEVQNALLKTLEESSQRNQFILTVANFEKIIPTVKSRSKAVYLNKNYFIPNANKKTEELINLVKDSDKLNFLSDGLVTGIDREKALDLFDELILYFKSRLETEGLRAVHVLKKILKIKELLENNNLNPQLTVDNLLIFIKNTYSIKVNQNSNVKTQK